MPTYHFDVGDSTTGPIGFCASVRAKSKEAALEKLKEVLPESIPADQFIVDDNDDTLVMYIQVYLNADALTIHDIDSEEDIQDEVLSEGEKKCKRCGEATDDGEGEQGFCGNCADRALRCKVCDELVQPAPSQLRDHLEQNHPRRRKLERKEIRAQFKKNGEE